ncbi:MAG: response regulator [Spirochaetes bacterium]|nr:response regulator [Spirochaetota bacterium]
MKKRILVVDDEPDILELVRFNLEKEGFEVKTVQNGEEALRWVNRHVPDCIILDLMLPGLDGIEVCRRIKGTESLRPIPILMLTAKAEETDMVIGLEIGADDYITKPFSPKVLVARVRAALRRNKDTALAPQTISVQGIEIDLNKHEVRVDGHKVELSATEFALLELLARKPGWVYSRAQIIDGIKGKDYPVTERSVDVQILSLRKKLMERGKCIVTVRGVGYKLEPDVCES